MDLNRLDVVVISLRRSIERRRAVKRQLKEAGLSFRFFDAFDNNQIDYQALVDNKRLAAPDQHMARDHYTKGEIGCYLSHAEIWAQIIADSVPATLVFEDDALIPRDLLTTLGSAIESLPGNVELVYLGGFHNDAEMLARVPTDVNGIAPIGAAGPELWGSHGYLVSEDGAAKLLREAFPIRCPVDIYMMWHKAIAGEINCRAFVPEIVRQDRSLLSNMESTDRGRHHKIEGSEHQIVIRDGKVLAV